jgi:hypothetical protein
MIELYYSDDELFNETIVFSIKNLTVRYESKQ